MGVDQLGIGPLYYRKQKKDKELLSMDTKLTDQEKAKAARIAGSVTAKILFGGAVFLKATGVVINKATDLTSSALRSTADGVDYVGHTAGDKCIDGGEYLAAKADEYDPGDLPDEAFTVESAEGVPA